MTRFLGIAGAAVVAFLLLLVTPAGAAPALRYVALGDSFAAGPLAPPPGTGPFGCLRSGGNYPSLLARAVGASGFRDVTCSGATTADLTAPQQVALGVNPPQLDAVTPDTDLVTLTIGGNDLGFTEILVACGLRSPLAPAGAACRDHYGSGGEDELAARVERARPSVEAALAEIRSRAPEARVLLVGYPALLPDTGPGCFPLVPFSAGDVAYLRTTEKSLNAMLAGSAATAGATYVDTYTPSLGHDACAAPGERWVEALVPTSPAAPVHPNAAGMAGMARAAEAALMASPVS